MQGSVTSSILFPFFVVIRECDTSLTDLQPCPMKKLRSILCILFCCSLPFHTIGQNTQHNEFFSIEYKSTLDASGNQKVLDVGYSLVNLSGSKLLLKIYYEINEEYSLISASDFTRELNPGERAFIPLNIAKSNYAKGGNSQLILHIDLPEINEQYTYPVMLNNKVNNDFSVSIDGGLVYISEKDQMLRIPFQIRNKGNKPSGFTIMLKNELLNIQDEIHFRLGMRKDTMVTYTKKVSSDFLSNLINEKVKVKIYSDSSVKLETVNVKKLSSKNKEHASAYSIMPVTLRTNTSISNSQTFTTASIEGSVDLAKKGIFSYGYGTRILEQKEYLSDLFYGMLNFNKWSLRVGFTGTEGNFNQSGLGAEIGLKFGKVSRLKFKAVRGFHMGEIRKGESYSVNALIGNNKWVFNTLGVMVKDSFSHSFSYLGEQGIKFKGTKVNLSLSGGLGFAPDSLNLSSKRFGYRAGFDFIKRGKIFSLSSSISIYDSTYPGYMAGTQNINSSGSLKVAKNLYLETNYYLRKQPRQVRDDSILNQVNSFMANNQRLYGGLKIETRKTSMNFGFGYFQQFLGADRMSFPKYQSITASFFNKSLKDISISFTGVYNMNSSQFDSAVKLRSYSIGGNIRHKLGGIMGSYSSYPSLKGKTMFKQINNFVITPYVNFNFFNKKLNAHVVYNIASTGSTNPEFNSQAIRKSLSGTLTYQSARLGMRVSAFTNAFYGPEGSDISYNLMLEKNLNIPIIFKKRYRSIKVNLFEDKNYNGIKDPNEGGASEASITINEKPFLSSKDGSIAYENLDTGKYDIVFNQSINYSNLISVNGYKQTVDLRKKDVTINIPLNKAQVLKGTVSLITDKNSSSNYFEVENLKITAVDSLGNSYSAYTNKEGQFLINLPKGEYVVSLNPKAFTEFFIPDQISQKVDMANTDEKTIYFTIRQKERRINKVKASF